MKINTGILAIVIFFVCIGQLNAQDLPDKIFLESGQIIDCKITLINEVNVFYEYKRKKRFDVSFVPIIQITGAIINSNDIQVLNNNVNIIKGEKTILFPDTIKIKGEKVLLFQDTIKIIKKHYDELSGLIDTTNINESLHSELPITDSILISNIKKLEIEIMYIKLNLDKHFREFNTGTVLGIGGLGATLVGTAILYFSESPNVGVGFLAAGSIAMFAGWIIRIDSHKWFRRASIYSNNNGLTLGLKL